MSRTHSGKTKSISLTYTKIFRIQWHRLFWFFILMMVNQAGYAAPFPAPTISNLNGDSVAWPDVGNTVTLDAGGDATVADTEFDATSWDGASLTVQRNVGGTNTPINSDVFSFNASGYTVSGGNLQTSGTTFGTFTNTNGVLSISFNANATNSLVRDVMRSIQYRNDTPAGNATIRFALSDGTTSTTADVTVTSDTIYVTNTTDTATIDLTNGVSFSEAVAIAAADVTGSQTLILSSAFTGNMSLAGNLAINESLAINGDSANGLILTGSTITLAGGTTLNLTNASGILTIGSTLAGSGALSKSGAGTLALSSTTNNSGWSGALSILGGTLSVSGSTSPTSLPTGTLTLNGGTLSMTVLGTPGTTLTAPNSIVLGASGGTIAVGGNDALNMANFSGVISGSGSLAKSGMAILRLSGTNEYTGTTNVSAGTLRVASDSNMGAGNVTLASGVMLDVTGVITIDNSIALSGGATINNAGSVTLSGVVSGANTLTKSGSGTLTLSGTNSYSGTTVNAGTLRVAGDANLGSGAITLNNGTLAVTSAATIDNAITLTEPGTLDAAAATTLTGQLSGDNYRLSKTGAGDLTIANSNNTNMTGEIAVFEANLLVADGSYMPRTVVLRGGNLTFTAATTTTGIVAVQADSTITTNGNVTFSDGIELEEPTHTLTKAGSGTLTLTSLNNSGAMAGKIAIQEGTLSVSDDRHLNAGDITINGGTLAITATGTYDNNLVIGASNAVIDVSNSATATLSGTISGAGGFGKTGAGSLRLSGAGSFTGATNANAGSLLVNGTLSGTSAVTVASGATLGGTGSIFAVSSTNTLTVQSGATLSPGNSAGAIRVNGNLQMNSGSTLAVEINGTTAGSGYDQVIVAGTVSIAGTLAVTHGYTAGKGDSYTIINNDMADAVTGTFSGLAEGSTITASGNGAALTASYIGGSGNDFTLTAPINAAPIIANLNGDSVNFIEDSALVLLDAGNDATVTDSDSVDFNGGNVTVSIINNRVDTEDVLSIRNEGTAGGQIGTSGLNITYGGTVIGTRTADGGTDSNDLVITLNSSATPAIVQALVRNLTYINTNTTEPTTYIRSVEVTVNDGDGGTSNGATIDVAVVALNDAPTLTATGGTPTFTEGGSAVDLYSTVAISTVETGQTLNFLTLKVTNVSDINAEILSVDGTDITLFGGTSGTTATNGMAYSVSSIGTTATVSLSKLIGLNAAAMETLVDGISYRNTSHPPTTVNRVVTLTELTDSGGTANSGQNTATLAVAATVNIEALNSAPVINGAPPTRVNRGGAYSFTPTASDVDTGTVLTYSINNKPSWAVFNTSTGALTGIPSSADVGITNGIVISVSDGALTASLPAFNLTVVNVNNTPVINGSSALTVDQDTAYAFLPMSSDPDGDSLTFTIVNKPAWASFSTATGGLSGTPTKSHVGVTNGIVISVSDGMLSTSLPAFNLTVVSKNEAPVIGGSPAVSVNQETAYTFVPTSSDANGDTLTFTIANQPSWASFDTSTGALSGTPRKTDVGTTTGILISVSDGMLSTSLPVFAIEVVSVTDPLQPIVTAPADLDVNATGLYTPISLRQLLSLSSSASQADIDQTLKSLASDGVSGNDCCTTHPDGLTDANNLLLRPGHHEVKWKATNASGMTGEATQVVNIRPIVSLSKSQIAVRGSTVEFRVILNGASPQYPLSIPYAIDAASSATAAEHNLSSGTATFTQEGQLTVPIVVQLAAVTGFSDSQLIITLGAGINAGSVNRHTIDIREGNVPPVVTMDIRQGGLSTSLITPTGGPVTINLTVTDANKGDTHTFDWSATTGLADTDGNLTNDSRTFDPAGLTGSHQVQVTTTDSAGASVQTQAYFRIVTTLPTLSETADTDKDGINDVLEGAGDTDNNGIPDYLDNMPSPNILPQTGNITNSYLIECDPSVRCGLGLYARGSTSGGVQVLNSEVGGLDDLIVDPAFDPVGGIFDFTISDLPIAGQSVRVVIPQQAPIPANGVYRKFQKGQWVNFISNTNNAIHSTAGNPGYCPPPGSGDWTSGLTQGHLCVQLTLEDGGPNDADGLVNAAVVDPGAVSTALPVVPPVQPPAEPPEIEVKAKRGGAMSEILLLLLVGLVIMSRVNSKRLAVAFLALVAANTQASSPANTGGDIYARVDIYQAKGDQTRGDLNTALTNAGHKFTLNSYDVSRMAYQVAVAYGWNDFTSTEIGYLDLGDTKVDLSLNGNEKLDDFGASLAKHYPRSASGVTLSQTFFYALGSRWRLAGDVGLFVWQDETHINIAGITLGDDDGVDPIVGLGVDYQINDAVRLGANIRQVVFDDQKVSLLGTSLRWMF